MFSLRAAVISYQLIWAKKKSPTFSGRFLFMIFSSFFSPFVCGWHFPLKKSFFSSSFEVERRLGCFARRLFSSVGGHTPKLIGGSGVDGGDWLPLSLLFCVTCPHSLWNESKSATVGRRRKKKSLLQRRTHYVIEIDPSFFGGVFKKKRSLSSKVQGSIYIYLKDIV